MATTTSEIRTDLSRDGVVEISGPLRLMLADVFSLYLKTKNFQVGVELPKEPELGKRQVVHLAALGASLVLGGRQTVRSEGPTDSPKSPDNRVHLNSARAFNKPFIGAHIMTATKATGPLAVLESGFKIIPGKETDFLGYQAKVVQLAMKQDGFRATYGSPILDSTWVYFGARFDSEEQMNAWHGEPQHRVIQKSAPNWWTALYLRKWRAPMSGEVLGDRLMSETSILVDTALDDIQTRSVRQALAELGDAGAQPFETLTGEFEVQPFQFTGPVQIAPAADKVLYLLVAHWSSADHFNAWKSSSSYRALQSLGDVSSELFVPIVETRLREHLRDDKLQRDWEWALEDRR
jgi:heme-degrading monooxygenase HmoA